MIKRITLSVLILLFMAGVISGCLEKGESLTPEQYLQAKLNSVDKTRLAAETKVIDDSLQLWGIKTEYFSELNGVRYRIQTLGSGPKPVLRSMLKLKYEGRLFSDSTVFEQQDNYTSYLYDLLVGMQTTLPLLNEGTKATLIIPSAIAFGNVDVRNSSNVLIVPKNSTLIFHLEMLDVQ